MTRSVRVTVDARLFTGASGGVETVVVGLADGLSAVEHEDVEISFAAYAGHTQWLAGQIRSENRDLHSRAFWDWRSWDCR